MDRPIVDGKFLYKMRSEREERLRKEMEVKVEFETGSRRAQESGYETGVKDAQEMGSFEELKAMAEKYQNYLDPNYMPHDRARLAKEWFVTRNGIVAPEPFSESWRIGYSRAIADVLRMIEKP